MTDHLYRLGACPHVFLTSCKSFHSPVPLSPGQMLQALPGAITQCTGPTPALSPILSAKVSGWAPVSIPGGLRVLPRQCLNVNLLVLTLCNRLWKQVQWDGTVVRLTPKTTGAKGSWRTGPLRLPWAQRVLSIPTSTTAKAVHCWGRLQSLGNRL